MKYIVTGILLLFAAGIIFFAGWNPFSSSQDGMPPLNTVVAEVGDVSRQVTAHGTLEPVQKVEVGSQVSGIIDEIFVDFNSVVTRGQQIAQIDPSTFRAAVNSAQAELESAEASLELAQVQWQRMKDLRERQFVALSEVDMAQAALKQAEAEVKVRGHALERAEREFERCTIIAPTDGIVISRAVDVGQTVAASLSAPVLFEIATDLRDMLIHAMVSEADIGTVQDGQEVRFVVDAYRNETFHGEVIQVRNAPIIEDNVVHYETIIRVNNEDGKLKPGMTAEVNIITDQVFDVTRIRNTALRARLPDHIRPPDHDGMSSGDPRVYLLRNGELTSTPVETGLSDGLHTEIISGISVGDTLAVGLSLQAAGGESERRGLFSGNQAQY